MIFAAARVPRNSPSVLLKEPQTRVIRVEIRAEHHLFGTYKRRGVIFLRWWRGS
jgi:hypothetical protein